MRASSGRQVSSATYRISKACTALPSCSALLTRHRMVHKSTVCHAAPVELPYHREIIAYAVRAYHRFALSRADIGDMIAEGSESIGRETMGLCWRAGGANGDMLDILVQGCRNTKAAKRFIARPITQLATLRSRSHASSTWLCPTSPSLSPKRDCEPGSGGAPCRRSASATRGSRRSGSPGTDDCLPMHEEAGSAPVLFGFLLRRVRAHRNCNALELQTWHIRHVIA